LCGRAMRSLWMGFREGAGHWSVPLSVFAPVGLFCGEAVRGADPTAVRRRSS
jgi:hypothetical protein